MGSKWKQEGLTVETVRMVCAGPGLHVIQPRRGDISGRRGLDPYCTTLNKYLYRYLGTYGVCGLSGVAPLFS